MYSKNHSAAYILNTHLSQEHPYQSNYMADAQHPKELHKIAKILNIPLS
jgi:hypothetical protein